jgi:hypothetical protein
MYEFVRTRFAFETLDIARDSHFVARSFTQKRDISLV